MKSKLEALAKRLKDEQCRLIEEAAKIGGLPSSGTIRRIAEIELNITAVENTLDGIRSAPSGIVSRTDISLLPDQTLTPVA
jgi:hypothetical protein